MILIKGDYNGTGLTGTVFEPNDTVPAYKGAPSVQSNYTWICDSFYEVDEGGTKQDIDGEEKSIVFERPIPKGFINKKQAIEGGKNHIRTQFQRIGASESDVTFNLKENPN